MADLKQHLALLEPDWHGGENLGSVFSFAGTGGHLTQGRSDKDIFWSCFMTTFLCVSSTCFRNPLPHGRSRSWAVDAWQYSKMVVKTLFAPELIIVHSLTKTFQVHEDLKAARQISDESWTSSVTSLITDGNVVLRDPNGHVATLPRPSYMIVGPHPELWQPILRKVRKSITSLEIRDRDKTDSLTTALTALQVMWFILCIFDLVARHSIFSQNSAAKPAGITLVELYTLTMALCTLSAQAVSWRTTSNISEPFSIPVETLPKDHVNWQQRLADTHLVEVRRSKIFVNARPFSKIEDGLPLTFHLIKLYFFKLDYSLSSISDILAPSFLSQAQASKVFSSIGILILSALINSALIWNSSRDLTTPFEPEDNNWRFYSYRETKILVERNNPDLTILDSVKIFLQDYTDKPIIWWPLTKPVSPLSPGRAKISWVSDDSEDLSINVSTTTADAFEKRLRAYGAQNGWTQTTTRGQGSPDGGFGSSNSSSPPAAVMRAPRQAEASGVRTPPRKGKAPRRQYALDPSVNIGLQATNHSPETDPKKLIHWCIGKGTAHVHNICVEGVEGARTGTNFINELKDSYRSLRGLRHWFSLTDLATVRFIKFIRILNTDSPVKRRQNAVTVADIKSHGEYEIETSSLLDDEAHIEWAEAALSLHLQDRCNRDDEINAVIAGLPRKKLNLTNSLAQSTGYGVVGEQGWAVWRCFLIIIISSIGGLSFFVWWLIVHPGDLQNASVPFLRILSFLATFIAVPDYIL